MSKWTVIAHPDSFDDAVDLLNEAIAEGFDAELALDDDCAPGAAYMLDLENVWHGPA